MSQPGQPSHAFHGIFRAFWLGCFGLLLLSGPVQAESSRLSSKIDAMAIEFSVFLLLVIVGFISGTVVERRHYASIKLREQQYRHLPAFPMALATVVADGVSPPIARVQMVIGSVVLSEDYFKAMLGNLKTFFGGNLTAYESLMDRARREAILRMKDQAPWADVIVNLRLETSSIGKEGGQDGKGPKSVEMVAYGTAIGFQK
jgi:uncharacterized protein YbjQ (UPF0145 family)